MVGIWDSHVWFNDWYKYSMLQYNVCITYSPLLLLSLKPSEAYRGTWLCSDWYLGLLCGIMTGISTVCYSIMYV